MTSEKGDSDMTLEKLDSLGLKTIGVDTRTANTDTLLELLLGQKELKWSQLLCHIGNIDEFIDIFHSSRSELLAIMKYRRILHQRGMAEVSFIEVNTAYTNKQFNKLHKLLEKMFLEPISDEQFEFILKKIDNREDGIENLYNRHVEDKGLRILTVALII